MGEFISRFGNPWSADQWNVTTQGRFLQAYGRRRADQFAALAGTTVGGPRPDGAVRVERRTYIITRKIGGVGGGLVGAGSSGEGPPSED